jgi:alpha-L-rhamnosidase
VYDAQLNGHPVTDFFLAPGWTSYLYRHQVQEYDVTHLIETDNRLDVLVGSGWFNGEIARARRPKEIPVLLLAQLDLYYTDGHTEHIYTDESWMTTDSNIREADIYQGETCDMGFTDISPVPAVAFDYPKAQLIPQEGEKITFHEHLKPVRVFTTPAGETVLDFGQEITGIIRVELDAPAGTVLTFQCAEVLDADGNFYTANYRRSRSTMELHCSGPTCWQPRLTYYGFRYLRITGWPGTINPDALTAIVAHSEMTRTGRLSCGVPKLNRLFENVVWGQKGNFVDVPTDCPQRDERLGWTADAQIFSKSAMWNMDCRAFFKKYLADVRDSQLGNGVIPAVAPVPPVGSYAYTGRDAAAGWCEAIMEIVPP